MRVHSLDEIAIKKALDSGASGIIVPQINSAEQAAKAVAFAKYSPGPARYWHRSGTGLWLCLSGL
ncbi:MAG: hypothetical protein AB9Q23_11715 [Candidatus Reddybacter sp.]